MFGSALSIFGILIALVVIVGVVRSVKIIAQARAGVVERLGKYRVTLDPGPHLVIPFIDNVRYTVDLREQVVSFPPQDAITEDNLVVQIDTVIYFKVIDPVDATYSVSSYVDAIHQLTSTTLRNIIGGMTLEHALTSRDQINTTLSGQLDVATGKWGIKVGRVELKAIDPPASIIDAMEKQTRADRDKRAIILTAEGDRQSAILSAEGDKQSAILKAEGERQAQILSAQADRQSAILRAQGEGQAIQTVFQSIHDGNPDQKLLTYQYLQTLPQIAQGENASTWIIPAELTRALNGIGAAIGDIPVDSGGSKVRVDLDEPIADDIEESSEDTTNAVEEALEAAKEAAGPGGVSGSAASQEEGPSPTATDTPDPQSRQSPATPEGGDEPDGGTSSAGPDQTPDQ